jgi:hypothetical protein|tara:strand:+ start:5553 stop:6047 length:495 start_codon:yes stop_codon:yes gene_type:complete
MAERMTDKFNRLFSSLVNAVVNWTKAGAGLPITVINTVPVLPAATTNLTITMPVDSWVCGVYPTVLNVAAATAAQVTDGWCSRIDIAGFQIWSMQGLIGPVFGETTSTSSTLPLTNQAMHGYARPFLVRQGDTITVSFTSLSAANTYRGTVFIDAYRADSLTTA